MNINWRVRLQNKTFLTGLISLVVVFVYDLLQLLAAYRGGWIKERK